MLPFDDFQEAVAQVGSANTARHCWALYGLIKWLRPSICVEVGAFHGFTTCWIARALQENAVTPSPVPVPHYVTEENGQPVPEEERLRYQSCPPMVNGQLVVIDDYSLDPNAERVFWYNLGLTHTMRHADGQVFVHLAPVRSDTEGIWPEQIDFAYIDGDHSFEGAMNDFLRAEAAGAKCIVVHDTTSWWGPRRVVDSWLPTHNRIGCWWDRIEVPFDEGLAICMKRFDKPREAFEQAKFPTGAIVPHG